MAMANDTCPHCGAERRELTSDGRFACGTLGGFRSPFCYSQQLATVTAERDEERENSRILQSSRDEETAIADSWMRKCNELEQQLGELRRLVLTESDVETLRGLIRGVAGNPGFGTEWKGRGGKS